MKRKNLNREINEIMKTNPQKNIVLSDPKTGKKQNSIELIRKKEAKIRRCEAAKWEDLAERRSYKKASTRESCLQTTLFLEEELFGDTAITFNEQHYNLSHNAKKRILRRIVEKKQAQSVHKQIGKTFDRFSTYMEQKYISKSFRELQWLLKSA